MERELSINESSTMNTFVARTYQLLTASMVAATAGAFIGVEYNSVLSPYYIGLVIIEIILLFAVMFTKKVPGVNLMLLFAFTMFSGLTLGPILTATLSLSNGASIVMNALLLTTAAFGGLTLFAMTTKHNLMGIGKYLFIGLIVIVVAMVINLFLGSSLMATIISAIAAILFSVMIVYDTQRIYQGAFDTPVEAALSMYLNILNLFISLLSLLRTFTGED